MKQYQRFRYLHTGYVVYPKGDAAMVWSHLYRSANVAYDSYASSVNAILSLSLKKDDWLDFVISSNDTYSMFDRYNGMTLNMQISKKEFIYTEMIPVDPGGSLDESYTSKYNHEEYPLVSLLGRNVIKRECLSIACDVKILNAPSSWTESSLISLCSRFLHRN